MIIKNSDIQLKNAQGEQEQMTIEAVKTNSATEVKKPKQTRKREKVLTTRDTKILTWIGEMYTARLDLIQRMLGDAAGVGSKPQLQSGIVSESTARQAITRWREAGLVEYRKIIGDEPLYIWLTSKGLREMGLVQYSYQPPSLSLIKHYHVVTLVRRYIEKRNPDITWKSERAIRGEVASIDAKLRVNKHVPDGVIVRSDTMYEDAIEVEITRKAKPRQEEVISRLARDYRASYYFVTPQTEMQTRELVEAYKNKFSISQLSAVVKDVGIEL